MLTPRRKDDLTLVALVVVFVFSAVDVVDDYGYGAGTFHLIGESVVMLMALLGVVVLWSQRDAARRQAALLGRDLERAQAEARRWEQETRHMLHGLGHAMARQFDRWGLSGAEREVAALLLKGLRHKEIASSRGTSERTVRQQAFTVYRKAGLTSRTELAAFFLDGALEPAVHPVERKEPEPVSA